MSIETILVGVAVAVITVVGSIVVAVIGGRSNKQTTAVSFSHTLIERLETVEAKVTSLETEVTSYKRALNAAVRFIDRLVEWGRSGGKTAMPAPPESLHQYLDADLWPERATGAESTTD